MENKQGRNIAIVGGSGNVGTPTTEALLSYGIHTITAISRIDSAAIFPSGVTVKKGSYDDKEFLLNVLKGQDVLILQLPFMALGLQLHFIDAAAEVGVPWVIPTEYALDNKHEKLNKEVVLMAMKNSYRDHIDSLGISSWIGIVNGPWFDWSFEKSYWGFDLKTRKATIFDSEVKFNTTTLSKVGKSLAALLSLPDSRLSAYKNDFVYFSSFLVSHYDIFDSVLYATGTGQSDWDITREPPEKAAEEAKEAMKQGNPLKMADLMYATISREGYGGDYSAKVLGDELLGLEKENLDEVVKDLVLKVEKEE